MIEIRVQNAKWYAGYEMMIWQINEKKEEYFIGELSFKKNVEGGTFCDPTLIIGKNDLHFNPNIMQTLMDDLWNCGIRPSEGTGSAGSLKATQYHLEDMRKLIFEEIK